MTEADNNTQSIPAQGKTYAALAAALLPVLVFYGLLFHSMRDEPIMDDYRAILAFVLSLKQLPTLSAKLLYLFTAQFHEYKLVFEHVIVALQWAVTGKVSFSFLIVLGNFFILGVFWLFWKNYFLSETSLCRRLVLFLPICYLLFQLNYVETLDMAMCDLQNVPILFFSLASLSALVRSGRRMFLLATLLGFIACLTSANGFLVGLIGLLLLVPRRAWAHVALWCVTFSAALAIYLYKYVMFSMLAGGAHVGLMDKTFFYLSLLGGAVENMHRFPVKGAAIVVGILILATFFRAWRSGYQKSHPFAFYAALWSILSGVLIAQGRSGLGITLSLMLRYKIYSDLLLIFCYGYAVSRLDTTHFPERRKHLLFSGVLAAVVLFSASSDYFGYKFMTNRQVRDTEGLNEYEADPARNVPMLTMTGEPIVGPEPEEERKILTDSIQSGIYTLPPPAKR